MKAVNNAINPDSKSRSAPLGSAVIDTLEVLMRILNNGHNILFTAFLVIAAQFWVAGESLAQTQTVSIFIVRHAEADTSQPMPPLTAVGRQRADLLIHTLRGVKFTHIFASHTTRTRQMAEGIASVHGLPIVQLPAPGSILDGKPVTDQISRRAPIEPISAALLQLPPGSVALVALNSENIFAILNRLGVPVAPAGQPCVPGSMCVPCADNSCYPRHEFDHMWHIVREPGRPEPLAFVEFRYGAGWRASDR
ncbi:MAG: histidine phosphatase family protein [Gammaproteobacteria bacterium]|nr:histidine phosphatase family protein [Gammaproteobacteria bacterium]